MMRLKYIKTMLASLALIVLIAGCSSKKTPPSAAQTPGGNTIISIKAGGYRFEPSLVRVEKPGAFILQVRNTTGSELHMSLKDAKGKAVANLKIGPKATAISNIELPESGSYEFANDKRLYSSMGMKGRIVVGSAK